MTTPAQRVAHLSFSADGRRAAYAALNDTATVYRAGFDPATERLTGEPMPVTTGTRVWGGLHASADGEWLAAHSTQQQEDIYIFRSDGSSIRQLTDDAFNDRLPRWAPDGSRLAFYSNRSVRYEIWTIRPDGSDLRQITRAKNDLLYPVWSNDSTRLAAVDVEARRAFVFSANSAPSEQQPEELPVLTDRPAAFETWSWSPDGEQILGRVRGPTFAIYAYSFRTRQYTRIAADLASGIGPLWLNDSRRVLTNWTENLVLIDRARGTRDIFNVRPDVLTGLAVSQDNRKLFFIRSSRQADIWMLTIN